MTRSIYIMISILALMILFTSCGVTETGNPLPVPAIGDLSERGPYVNETYGVTVHYPSEWLVLEDASKTSVEFTDGADIHATVAVMSFSILEPVPETLFAYLHEQYPSRTFINYTTDILSGYFFDDPAQGANGGDAREYFFIIGDVLITVEAEIFETGEDDFFSLLEGISIQ